MHVAWVITFEISTAAVAAVVPFVIVGAAVPSLVLLPIVPLVASTPFITAANFRCPIVDVQWQRPVSGIPC